ncbi:MAG: dienelactone hydrolase family protein [Hyalangium sp.]|uniref:dienelactone hydrolase family protein n=1 Tax=Hyalangium sp. TaxID=2028555 RepID=UPI00389AC972
MRGEDTDVREVQVRIGEVNLGGSLGVPQGARGLVIFAHGSGSSRFSPRNQAVARTLREAGLATLLFDLLSPEEEAEDAVTAELRFDIAFLARRLEEVSAWVERQPELADLPRGYFGSSTGAAAALVAAARRPQGILAVVSRGGRPDLAMPVLDRVRAPTLLLVGGADTEVLELNEQALDALWGLKEMRAIPGATHLFEEPGALEQVARFAADWFTKYLGETGWEAHP